MSSSDDYNDLTPYIPQIALDTRDSKPNIRNSFDTISAVSEGYDNRTGNLANLIESAADNNQIVDLEGGTFEMDSGVSVNSGTFGVVGNGSDSATIYHRGVDTSYLFSANDAGTFVLEGVTVDITEEPPNDPGLDTDVGLASVEIQNRIWAEDVELRGQRHLNQDYDGSGIGDPPNASRRMTFLMEMTTYDGVGYMHDCRFPDGGTDEAEAIGNTVGHAIGPNADPSHIGTNIWHECHVAGFMDNGFYVNNSAGPNIIWDCTANNCGGGNVRLGNEDTVIGGSSEVTDTPDGRLGKALDVNFGNNIEVYGFRAYGEGDNFGTDLIQIRDGGDEDEYLENLHLEKIVAHANGDTRPIRYSGEIADITVQDCYFLDTGTHTGSAQIMMYNSASVTAENVSVHSDNGGELYIAPNTGATYSYDGQTYGEGTYTASMVGFDDPRPLPNFYFGESDVSEYDVVFEIIDDETSETIEGATVSVGDQSDITTGSDGIADFGTLGTGDYSYTVNADGYNSVNGTYTNNTNATNTVALNPVSEDDGKISLQVTNRDSVGIGGVTVTLYESN